MNVTAVEAAQSKGWRHIYFNALSLPFWGVHILAIVGLAITGFSWLGLALVAAMYLPRMFFVTGAYHRYFSHRSYKTSRWFQFVLALGAVSTAQKGVLWWAAHHRVHHKLSDAPGDLHSVKQSGFWWAHMGWILARDLEGTDMGRIKDFSKYPELRWLDRWWMIPPIAVGALTFAIGGFWARVWGGRRYETEDDSRNNPVLAAITMGEGWHNNHHHYQVSARQGFYWWEYDATYYVLRALAAVGLVWDLHGVPDHIKTPAEQLESPPALDVA